MYPLKSMLGAAVAVAIMIPTAVAADPGKGKTNAGGHGNGKAAHAPAAVHGKSAKPASAAHVVNTDRTAQHVVTRVRANNYFDRADEAAIRRYYATSASCPPGLAAKRNGCLPPGQAKKAWAVGSVIPRDVTLYPLSGDLLGRLPVAPNGYYYGRYDGDVYLVQTTTRRIVDTIIFNLVR